jgi:protein-S-isoprenylcysteine O-methyltransferase Ste14
VLPTSPPGWFIAGVLAMLALHVAAPGPRWLAPPWTLLGMPLLAAGIAIHAWALRVFRRSGTTSDPEGRPSVLVRSGPYARSRNPMYLAGLPILAGVAVLFGTTTPVFMLPLYALGATRWVAREEGRMRERFGAEWEGYRGAVRRWI